MEKKLTSFNLDADIKNTFQEVVESQNFKMTFVLTELMKLYINGKIKLSVAAEIFNQDQEPCMNKSEVITVRQAANDKYNEAIGRIYTKMITYEKDSKRYKKLDTELSILNKEQTALRDMDIKELRTAIESVKLRSKTLVLDE